MTRRQKHKDRKRPKHWHRGQTEATRWQAIELPDVATGADPTTGTPRPLRRNGTTRPGDAL